MSADKRSDYSFFRSSREYPDNPLISDAFKRTIGFDLRIDPNKYLGIDWGDGEISKFRTTEYPRLYFRFDYSGKNLNSTFENRKYSINIYGQHRFNAYLGIRYRLGAVYINGSVPYQDLTAFQTLKHTEVENSGFSVMDYNEYLGDKLLYFNFENNFGRLLWRNIPYIKSLDLIGFFNAGRSDISTSNKSSLSDYPFNPSVTDGVFMEAGFGIDRILEFGKINLGWRLNNLKSGKNFFIFLSFGL
jgi:hypothetical protein